jgi:hypothetical protein
MMVSYKSYYTQIYDVPAQYRLLSDVVTLQKQAADDVMEWNDNGVFPDPNPKWRRPHWAPEGETYEGDVEAEMLTDHIRWLEEANTLANHRFNLAEVKIDCNMVMLGLDGKGSQAEYMGVDASTHFVLLGDIKQMPHHVVVTAMAGIDHGQTLVGFHDDNFYVIPPGET